MAPKQQIFVNLPSKNIEAAERFATSLGFTKKEDCGPGSIWFAYGDTGTSLFYHDPKTFGSFIQTGSKVHTYEPKVAATTTEVILTLAADSKDEVDSLVSHAIEAGGEAGPMMVPEEEQQKHNMYSRSVVDPDGHLFEFVYCPKAPWMGD